jgi:hypothetical protein
MHRRPDEPFSARLTWEEVHRLELLMRARARSLGQTVGSADRCPACGRPVGESEMRIGGYAVHPECVSLDQG